MHRSPYETACILAVILKRSGQNRARISSKTIRWISGRVHLRSAFVIELISILADRFDWILFELAAGGFGAIQSKSVEAAKPVTAKRWLTDDERKAVRRRDPSLADFEEEAAPEQDQPDDD